jgi:hypothetical protein
MPKFGYDEDRDQQLEEEEQEEKTGEISSTNTTNQIF